MDLDYARENSYSTSLANSSLLPLMLVSLMTQKNSPSNTKTPSDILSEYDYIIVGAGSAGSTVAGRLSERPCANILLIEAGQKPPILDEVPGFARNFWFSDIDWQFLTVPQKHTGRGLINRQVVWPSGKGLGGSSLLNAMLFVRGNKINYDEWEANGAKGWSYEKVFPYFIKMEDNRNLAFILNGYHGARGPVTMEVPRYHPLMQEPLYEAGQELGYQVVDSNGRKQEGFTAFQGTLRNNQRCSTAKAYLVPAENRENLDILPNAFVTKILIENKRAVGVSFESDGKKYEVRARQEVILSAGTTNSAQLLMLSGIGPKEELKKHNIPVVADLKVGENFHDHCSAVLNYELDSDIPTILSKYTNPKYIMEYIENRSGPLASLEGVSGMAFLNQIPESNEIDDPFYQLYFAEAPPALPKFQFGLLPEVYQQVYGPYENKPFYLCLAQILKPKSRGTVKLQSSDPKDPPLIDPNYFDDPEDLNQIIAGMKACQKIGKSKAMQKVGSRPFNTSYPGCEKFLDNEEKYFECQARSAVITMSHQVGTAKMGDPNDPDTVVDPQLRVKGISGLRVVDASVIPTITWGNTNVPVIMIAEKASDMIKESMRCWKAS